MQVGVVIIPQVAVVFKLVPLDCKQWLYTTLISMLPIVIMEVQKRFEEFKFGKIIYEKEEPMKMKQG